MSKRRVIEDSDDESVEGIVAVRDVLPSKREEVVLSPMSSSSDDECNNLTEKSAHANSDQDHDAWFAKRDTTTMTMNEKRRNIDMARKQGQLKKRRVMDRVTIAPMAPSPPAPASAHAPLIRSRHTNRVYESPTGKYGTGGVADYELSMALLNDTPDEVENKRQLGFSRLAKAQAKKSADRSNRLQQREAGRKEHPICVESNDGSGEWGSESSRMKKKKSNRGRRDDDEDDMHSFKFYGGDVDDDEKEGAEEERKRQILEINSRQVIERCSELSVTLRKALRSWQSPVELSDENMDGASSLEKSDCVNLSKISYRNGVNREGDGGEAGTHLLQQRDIQEVCPSLILKDYQLVGVNWLKLLHQNDVNGVLADDMGLGKTVQTISFLAWLFKCREDPLRLREQVTQAHAKDDVIENGDDFDEDVLDDSSVGTGADVTPSSIHRANPNILPHLVVVPASTLANWCKEFEKFCPTLNVMRFHGTPVDKEDMKYRLRRAFLPKYQPPGGIAESDRIDVVITTYTMFERESGAEDRSFLRKIPFEYLVLDEAHCIKNSQSSRYQNLRGLNPRRRLLLSGTPVQNDVRELLALLSFLMPKVFKMEYIDYLYDSFMDRFIDSSKQGESKNKELKDNKDAQNTGSDVSDVDKAIKLDRHTSSLQELRCMLAPFVLRRIKCDVLSEMPPKIDVPIKLKMTERQSSLYENIISTHLVKKTASLDMDVATNDEGSSLNLSTSEASNIFSDLRKASNHPLLLRTHFIDEKVLNSIADVCFAVQHFGDQCDQSRVYQELIKFSDFDLNYLCLEYPSYLGAYQLPSSVLYDSPKMVRLKTLLPKLIDEGHRVLIFSQWTKMMDIIGALLGDMQYKFLRLDGSTPVKERQRLIEDFETHVDIPIFVLSTRAGGLGINLTAADTVILHDLDFNPENDRQAEDRCHRIGQMKNVSVYKLITEESVDENIFDMGERKKRLSKAVLADGGEGDGGGSANSKDTSEINRMLQLALQKSTKKKQSTVVDLSGS